MTNDEAMTDEAEAVAAVRARIKAIEVELFAPANYAACAIVSPDAAERNRERNRRFALLSQERVDLLGRLPKTGMQSGQRLVVSSALGSVTLREIEPEPEPYEGPFDEWDWSEE
jgi:hypothetical protein